MRWESMKTPGGENCWTREQPPQERARSSFPQDMRNQTEHDSEGQAEGGNPALTEDELDNLQGLFYLELL